MLPEDRRTQWRAGKASRELRRRRQRREGLVPKAPQPDTTVLGAAEAGTPAACSSAWGCKRKGRFSSWTCLPRRWLGLGRRPPRGILGTQLDHTGDIARHQREMVSVGPWQQHLLCPGSSQAGSGDKRLCYFLLGQPWGVEHGTPGLCIDPGRRICLAAQRCAFPSFCPELSGGCPWWSCPSERTAGGRLAQIRNSGTVGAPPAAPRRTWLAAFPWGQVTPNLQGRWTISLWIYCHSECPRRLGSRLAGPEPGQGG